MTKEFIINCFLLEESDIDEVNDLYNRTYKTERSNEKFRWEFLHAPAGKSIYVVAKDTALNKIVGTQCVIPIVLSNSKGEKYLTGKSEDTLVDPNYRGQNIFEKMYALLFDECRKAGIQYVWGFTSALKPFRKLGFETPFEHSQSMWVKSSVDAAEYISALNPANTFSNKLKIRLLAAWAKIRSKKTLWTSNKLPSAYSLKISGSDEQLNLDPLLKKMTGEKENYFFIHQDSEYIKWRLSENPYTKKLFHFEFFENKELVADFIFNFHKNKTWYLVQMAWNGKLNAETKSAMLKKSLKELCDKEAIAMVRGWNFVHNPANSEEIEILKKAGFVYLNRGISFVWKDISTGEKLDPNHFLLSRMATQGIF
jgi:GNAT superfamily N-acetyltransferase